MYRRLLKLGSKRRLFNDKSLGRILDNLIADNQLSFDFLFEILIKVYVEILTRSPWEFVRVLIKLLELAPPGKFIQAIEEMQLDDMIRLYLKFEEEKREEKGNA